jgi:hypothetical protein
VDIARIDSGGRILLTKAETKTLIEYARTLGVRGVGVSPAFIHLDVKSRIASWRYEGGKIIPIPVGGEGEFV